jgi:predicted transcriptional regulator
MARSQCVQREIVLSIRPPYVNLILGGQKTVELRRRFPSVEPGTVIYIYSSSPIRELVGFTRVDKIQRLRLNTLWSAVRKKAQIDNATFNSYFSGCSEGVAVFLRDTTEFDKRISLAELRKRYDFVPPQSYSYTTAFASYLK